MTDGPHPHPDGDEAVVEPEPNPYYEECNTERKAQLDNLIAQIQSMQDEFDKNVVFVLGGAFFRLTQLIMSQQAHLLALEQRIEEMDSQHRRHYHPVREGTP